MKRPVFLSTQDVLRIHADAIEHEGGLGGLRDLGLLESAVMTPQQKLGGQFLHEGLIAMATAYLFHIANNHPFHDGNKRAGVMTAYVFLDVNGIDMTATNRALEKVVMAVADGTMSKADITEWFTQHTRARKRGR